MTTKNAKVAFSHQVEHLVNLTFNLPEESRKVSLNDNLVSFSGKFRESETDEGRRRYKYLELLEANHNLKNCLEESGFPLNRLEGEIREAANWFLQISGEPIPAGGYRVVEESIRSPQDVKTTIVIKHEKPKEMVNLRRLKYQLTQIGAQINNGSYQEALNAFESELALLIGNFRSPVLGIGAESMKQELKTLEKNLEEMARPPCLSFTKSCCL